jgi:hypothetical protein
MVSVLAMGTSLKLDGIDFVEESVRRELAGLKNEPSTRSETGCERKAVNKNRHWFGSEREIRSQLRKLRHLASKRLATSRPVCALHVGELPLAAIDDGRWCEGPRRRAIVPKRRPRSRFPTSRTYEETRRRAITRRAHVDHPELVLRREIVLKRRNRSRTYEETPPRDHSDAPTWTTRN